MVDDLFTHENILAVTFSEHSNAYEALSRLKELDATGEVRVRGAAVVVRDEDGKIETKEQINDQGWDGTASGGSVGLLREFAVSIRRAPSDPPCLADLLSGPARHAANECRFRTQPACPGSLALLTDRHE